MKRIALLLAVSVGLFSSCNKDPEVSFTSSAATIVAGESVTFTNGSSDKTYNPSWSFGDGGSATTWNASHVYQSAGTYTVTLSGTAKKGNKIASTTSQVVVTGRADDGVGVETTNMLVGSWKLSSSTTKFTPCATGGTSGSGTGTTAAASFVFSIISEGNGFYTNQNGVQQDFDVYLKNETTAWVSSFTIPMSITSGGTTATGDQAYPSGIYKVTIAANELTFTRTTDSYDNSNKCYDLSTFAFTLTK